MHVKLNNQRRSESGAIPLLGILFLFVLLGLALIVGFESGLMHVLFPQSESTREEPAVTVQTTKISPTGTGQESAQPKLPESGIAANTKWHYSIDVGGGVMGVMTVNESSDGKVSGTFTFTDPEGSKEESFSGSYSGSNGEITLGSFGTFIITISQDGGKMTGKPEETSGDIVYANDFFKATLEQ